MRLEELILAKKKKKSRANAPRKSEAKAPRMSASEFIAKVFDDKDFRQQVTIICYDYLVDRDKDDAMARWLHEGARRMGHKYTEREFIEAFNEQVSNLGFFKRTYLIGSLMGVMAAGRKAKQ